MGVLPDHVIEALPFKYIVHNEILITGSRANPNVAGKILNLVATGQLNLKDLISHVYPLEQFKEALETFVTRRDGAIKIVIEPNGPEGILL